MPTPEIIYSAVIERENTMGTAIEEGVAVPHARLPFEKKPLIVFGRSLNGIEWNSPDGKPTHFVFLIFTPRQDDWSQVQILRIIAKAMSNQETRAALLTAADELQVWRVLENAFTPHQIIRKTGKP